MIDVQTPILWYNEHRIGVFMCPGHKACRLKQKGMGIDMKKVLVVVDMQKDFVDGSLGSKEAVAIVDAVCRKIEAHDGPIIATRDTHFADYSETSEGKMLPVEHCIKGSAGWEIDAKVADALAKKQVTYLDKFSFGSTAIPGVVTGLVGLEDFELELIGLCTDICVVSNALILKASFSEKKMSVDSNCCAGVTPQKHEAALEVMRSCQIHVY